METAPAALTVQVKVTLCWLLPSDALTVTVLELAALLATVPKMDPVSWLMNRPAGSPVALNIRVPLLLSVADNCSDTASPTVLVWSPGLVRTMTPAGLMPQLKTSIEVLVPSLTVMVGV